MRVEVYRNLHKHCWSVRSLETGKVISHEDTVFIKNAKFIVQPMGREKVLREKRKNVHAFVRGILMPPVKAYFNETYSYNPYKFDHFYNIENEHPIYSSPMVMLDPIGHVRG